MAEQSTLVQTTSHAGNDSCPAPAQHIAAVDDRARTGLWAGLLRAFRRQGWLQQTGVQAWGWALLGVLMFSGGIPATRLAVLELPPLLVGAGRAALAGLFSLLLLWLLRERWPARAHWPALAIVAFGAVFAYPVFSAMALQHSAAGHATLVSALMPLFTAFFAAWLGRQPVKPLFWLFALLSAALVFAYNSFHSTGAAGLSGADLWLLAGCFCCGLAYAQGAMLARQLGSWQVICWALVLSLPLMLPLALWQLPGSGWQRASAGAWLGFLYLAVFSMFLGFFAWYRGLSLGNVAKISQLQQLTPFIALGLAASWLGESVSVGQLGVAAGVVVCIVLGKRFG